MDKVLNFKTLSSRAGTPENQIDIAELLANYGASLSSLNNLGYMPLHYCAIQVYIRIYSHHVTTCKLS